MASCEGQMAVEGDGIYAWCAMLARATTPSLGPRTIHGQCPSAGNPLFTGQSPLGFQECCVFTFRRSIANGPIAMSYPVCLSVRGHVLAMSLVLVNTNLEEPGAASEPPNKTPEQNTQSDPTRTRKKNRSFCGPRCM